MDAFSTLILSNVQRWTRMRRKETRKELKRSATFTLTQTVPVYPSRAEAVIFAGESLFCHMILRNRAVLALGAPRVSTAHD